MIPESEWRWFGSPGHFICSQKCRFHLCTQVGAVLVSTVGELLFGEGAREILAKSRGFMLEGKGDAREADYMQKIGYEDVGYGRKYETMAFRLTGQVCERADCGCGLPTIIPTELECDGYNTAGAATFGHLALCRKYALEQPASTNALDLVEGIVEG